MTRFIAIKFIAIAAALCFAVQADAQLTKYRFTGTVRPGNSHPILGTTISGVVTVDEGTPAVPIDGNFVRYGETAIEFETNTGYSGASNDDIGTTIAGDWDVSAFQAIFGPYDTVQLVSFAVDETPTPYSDAPSGFLDQVTLFFGFAQNQQNGSAALTNWNPLSAEERRIDIDLLNLTPDIPRASATFEIVTFEPVPRKILVNGVETGIEDFEYRGQLISERLDDIAAAAIQYGMYDSWAARMLRRAQERGSVSEAQVSQILTRFTKAYYNLYVSRLASQLVRAGLMTRSDARQLVETANQTFRTIPPKPTVPTEPSDPPETGS